MSKFHYQARAPEDVRAIADASGDASWNKLAAKIQRRSHLLTLREREFVRKMSATSYQPSAKQDAWLNDIAKRLGVAIRDRAPPP